ncbi:MAG: gliding motility protein GldM [Muribaculaceae bacterium]|nr:gliding motility protein GldM [Muribaculaceae bacterium]
MAGNNVARMSPRQRMINLMYIVLTAMLALNVSSDVLNGFSQVHDSISRTNKNIAERNAAQFRYLESLYRENPAKVKELYERGKSVRERSQKLFNNIEELKVAIAVATDGKDADYNNLKNLDDLESSSVIMLNPTTQRGKKLREAIESYKAFIVEMIPDADKRKAVAEMLSTTIEKRPGGPNSWEQKMFENMPSVAAITMLTKIQTDIHQAESEAMSNLILGVDMDDVHMNEFGAYVIPNSRTIIRGGKYSAQIVLAAVDTTARPIIYVNGSKLNNPNGIFEFVPGAPGSHEFSGYIELPLADGSLQKHPFKSSYTVIEPMATISPTMMNVLYAGIDNPISISVPGVPMSDIQASITGGSLTRTGDHWVARVSQVGSEATISVSAQLEGRAQNVGAMTFRVRKLPDPMPFISMKDASGNAVNYKGAPKRISKAALIGAEGLGAAIDDDILNVSYSVVSFSTIFFDQMGNAMPEVSNGSKFSERQREQFKRLKPGKSFFISNVKAKGPDGITRDIPPMEVALN